MMNIDLVQQGLSTLHHILLKTLYVPLDCIYQNAVFLSERYYYHLSDLSATDVFSFLNLQAILPPLIFLLTIYFAVISLYHTTTFFIRSTIFLVKWGALIGAVAASLGYVANTFGLFEQNTRYRPLRRNTLRTGRPRAWDSFHYHQQWRANEENSYVVDAGRATREMVERIIDAAQQAAAQGGWWLAGRVTKTFTSDDSTSSVEKKTSAAKGKGKIR